MFKQAVIAFCLLITCLNTAIGQSTLVKPSFEISTRIIYDLLIDNHGFLWIATDLGVSRFDGVGVVSFATPEQSSLAANNLCQDKEGRIWFSNFTGQIFYIQNEQMHLLKAYKFESESAFPQIALFNNQLIATTDKGLFVLNTATLTGKYIKSSNSNISATRSLAVMKDKVLVYDNSNWFLYKKDGSFSAIPSDGAVINPREEISSLISATRNDTALLQSKPSGTVRKVIIKNDSVKVCQKLLYNLINTVIMEAGNQWVNITKTNYSLKTKKEFNNYNVSDIVTDHEGNKWVSTVDNGLYVEYKKHTGLNQLSIPVIDSGDLVSTIIKANNNLLLGTKKGLFLTYDPVNKTLIRKMAFNAHLGPIKTIGVADSNQLYIGFSFVTGKLTTKGTIVAIKGITSAKQFLKVDHFTFISAANGLFAIPDNTSDSLKKRFVDLFGSVMKYDEQKKWYHFDMRCRAMAYYPEIASLVVSFKNGLFYINRNKISQVLYKKKPVYSGTICYYDGKLYVGTINDGLLIFDKSGIKNISLTQGLLSPTIFKLKPIGHHLWIIGSGSLQLMDLGSLQFINHFDLPSRKETQVTDVEELHNTAYFTTLTGLITYSLNKFITKKPPQNYLLGVKINNLNAPKKSAIPFSYLQNNISFRIGVPSFYYAKDIYIKYCLVNSRDTVWQVTGPGERLINFQSLTSGSYTFKALSVDPQSGLTGPVITYKFTISPPWWKDFWFRLLVIIIFLGLVNYFLISYYLNKISFQQALYNEQQSIRLERQRISSEIHDDIGSGLFAIHLFADMASKKRTDVKEIKEISTMVSDIAEKIKEIIWSTNMENDNLENMLYYIQFQVTKLFEHSAVNFQSSIPANIIEANVNTHVRRDIYLIVKEISHNAIKHSHALNIDMKITFEDAFLIFCIQDNGTGFNPDTIKINSTGLENIQSRIKKLNGIFMLEHNNGITVTVKIPINKILTKNFTNNIKGWQLQLFTLFKRSHIN